jgi:hypothetical protein
MNQFEGWRGTHFWPTMRSAYEPAERKAAMTAVVLKRKLRNFPTGNLSQRLATA